MMEDKVKGNDLIVMLKKNGQWNAIAYGKTCELDIDVESIGICNGRWNSSKPKKYRWRVSTSHLLSIDGNVDWQSLLEQETSVRLIFGTVERPSYLPDGGFGLKGQAKLVRYSLQAPRNSFASVSASFVGDGELESIYSYQKFIPIDYDGFVMKEDGLLFVNKIDVE